MSAATRSDSQNEARVTLNRMVSRKGQSLTEYAIILVLVVVVVLGVLSRLGQNIQVIYESVITSEPAGDLR